MIDTATVALPAGSRVLHIGPPKTGTTALQNAFHHNRDGIARDDVLYAGRNSQVRAAATVAATGRPPTGALTDVSGAWDNLVRDLDAATAKRVVISSESFSHADDAAAGRIIGDLGADRTYVVITARPPLDMLPSRWQQAVQDGSTLPIETWLDRELGRSSDGTGRWGRSWIDVLARRWGAHVGFDHVIVVSLAGQPRDFLLRSFEQLTGLTPGVLVAQPDTANPSLSYPATETLRRFNERYFSEPAASRDVRSRLMANGTTRGLKREGVQSTDEPVVLPPWAAELSTTLTEQANERLREMQVRVVGDLDALVTAGRAVTGDTTPPERISVSAAAELVLGMLHAGRAEVEHLRGPGAREVIRTAPTRTVLRGAAARLREPATRTLLLRAAGRRSRRAVRTLGAKLGRPRD